MNLLDENFPEDQRPLLRKWGILHRRVGRDVGYFGVQDRDVIPLLHRFRNVTFFTQDKDFFDRRLCHSAYCLVWLDVRADDAAAYTRSFLRHQRFDTKAQRMGVVARAHHDGIEFYILGDTVAHTESWR